MTNNGARSHKGEGRSFSSKGVGQGRAREKRNGGWESFYLGKKRKKEGGTSEKKRRGDSDINKISLKCGPTSQSLTNEGHNYYLRP
jgi:hypothetical protein